MSAPAANGGSSRLSVTTVTATEPGANTYRPSENCWPVVLFFGALVAAFLIVTGLGAAEAALGHRVLPLLDPLIGAVRQTGPATVVWLLERRQALAWAVTGAAILLALTGLLRRASIRRKARPLFLLAAGAALATWGQVLLFDDQIWPGAVLYLAGLVAAAAVGVRCPVTSLDGFPVLGSVAVRAPVRTSALPLSWELGLLFGLSLVALLLRVYALTELPSGFDLEMVRSMVESRTSHGIRQFFDDGFLTAAPGFAHILTQRLVFEILGTSFYSVRVAALLWGVMAVPLFYWWMRRIAGIGPAFATTVLFVASPEMLYWSRSENSFFAPVTVLALVAAHLGLSLVERFSVGATLAVAAWMPLTRYFYVPGFVLFAYPLLLFAHALIFVRGAWRRAWYVAPILGSGVIAWFLSISVVQSALAGWQWRFTNPTMVYGDSAWRKHGAEGFRDAGALELVRLQADLVVRQLGEVVHGLTVNGPFMFSHWFDRVHFLPEHQILLNVALTVTFVLGVGYMVGQVWERRAFALLAWLALGLLPGVMSDEPSGRRIAVLFPCVYAVTGIMFAAVVRVTRQRAGPWAAGLAVGLLGLVSAGISWAGLVSHYTLDMALMTHQEQVVLARPLFQNSDAIFTDVEDKAWREAQLLGNLDRFLAAGPCYENIRPRDWLRVALYPDCSFQDEVFAMTMPPERVRELARSYRPQRVSYISEQTASGRARTRLLRELYPSALVNRIRGREGSIPMGSVTVEMAEVEALHRPSLSAPAGNARELATGLLDGVNLRELATGLLDGVTLSAAEKSGGAEMLDARVHGGLLIPQDGWYRFRLTPPCLDAALAIGGSPVSKSIAMPLSHGVHPFEIVVAQPTSCRLPLQVRMGEDGKPEIVLGKRSFLGPSVLEVEGAAAPPVVVFEGYRPGEIFASVEGTPHAVALDSQANVSILVREHSEDWQVRRFDSQGTDLATWHPHLSANPRHVSMVVMPNGKHVYGSARGLLVTDSTGKRLGEASWPFAESPAEIAAWGDGEVLVVFPSRRSIAVMTLDGTLRSELVEFDGGRGHLDSPLAISVGRGYVLVIQEDGLALLFAQDDADAWAPRFLRSFPVEFGKYPAETRGAAFDGRDRLLIADLHGPSPMVYRLDGRKMLARESGRDLAARGIASVGGVGVAPDAVYVLDQSGAAVWRFVAYAGRAAAEPAGAAPGHRDTRAEGAKSEDEH